MKRYHILSLAMLAAATMVIGCSHNGNENADPGDANADNDAVTVYRVDTSDYTYTHMAIMTNDRTALDFDTEQEAIDYISENKPQHAWSAYIGHWHRLGDEDYSDRSIDVYVSQTGYVDLYINEAHRGQRVWQEGVWIDFEDDKSIRFDSPNTVSYLFGSPAYTLEKVD